MTCSQVLPQIKVPNEPARTWNGRLTVGSPVQAGTLGYACSARTPASSMGPAPPICSTYQCLHAGSGFTTDVSSGHQEMTPEAHKFGRAWFRHMPGSAHIALSARPPQGRGAAVLPNCCRQGVLGV